MAGPSGERAANLNDAERDEVEQRKPPRAAVLHETVGKVGEEELGRNVSSLAWSGIAAGLSMGFSMVASGALRAHLPHSPIGQLVADAGYSAGFVIVILARQQLFTENTLTVVLPLMSAPSWRTLLLLLRLWGIVLLCNLIGIAVFACGVAHLPLFDAAMAAVDAARLWIIIGLTWLIALAGLVHVIGSAGEVFFVMFRGDISLAAALGHFVVPTLAGNIVGGSLIFAMISHAQVRSEI